LNVSKVASILDETSEPEETERRFIDLYRDEETWEFWLMRLRNVDGLRERLHQIERARRRYAEGQFDSCVLHLIAVMDGFVNDFEPQLRKGLASREPDDMTAWDSVVGHHMGLTHALKSFTKTIKRRSDDEVFDVYRHGIMHGSVVHFNNVIVATKAWNMLFAVVDWASATTKSREPKPPKPSWRELASQIVENRKMKQQLDAWRPARYSPSDGEFDGHVIQKRTRAFLCAWRDRNFGELAVLSSRLIAGPGQSGRRAGEMREAFDRAVLTEFKITELENVAPAVWLARGMGVVNGHPGHFECRWLIEDEKGDSSYGSASGVWRLMTCGPGVWRRDQT
jgi:hypothetical protein